MRIVLLFFVLLLTKSVQAQDPIYSQFFSTPLEINPAFVGITYLPKFHLNYRNQWPQANAYQTYTASYDQYFSSIKSGVGLSIQVDNSGGGILQRSKANLTYGYTVRLRNKRQMKFGLEGGVIQNRLDWNKLVFLDQINPVDGSTTPTNELAPNDLTKTILDFGAGFLFVTEDFYVGFGVKHINTPAENFITRENEINNKLPMRMTFHAGYQYEIVEGSKYRKGISISPSLLIANQGKFNQLNLGAIMDYKSILVGAHYRHTSENPDAIIGYLGYEYQMYTVGYSYDYNISEIAGLGGAHELSLTINLDYNAGERINYNDCFELFR